MYHVSIQGIDEHMMHVHYYYHYHIVLYMNLDVVKLLKRGTPYPWMFENIKQIFF